MATGTENVVYFVSAAPDFEDPVDSAEFVSEKPEPAFSYIEDNQLESTHQVFQITSTSNLLSIWTGE